MKKYLIGLIILLLVLTGCVSTSKACYEYMSTVEVTGDAGLWKTKHYVDEFGNPTNDGYIMTVALGKFTNSATNGSDLKVEVLCNENDAEIELLEYGKYPINVIGTSTINIKINFEGQTVNLGRGWFSESTKRITINNALPLFKALVEHEKVTMYITIDNYGKSTYLFDIYSAGFEYNYKEAFLK